MKNMMRRINKIFSKKNINEKQMYNYNENQGEVLYFEMTKSYDTSAQSRELFKNEAAWLSAWEVWNK